MNNKDFYQLCYNQYQQELKESHAIYQRAGVLMVVLPLLATAMVALGRLDILKLFFTRVDICLYYIATIMAVFSMMISIVFLFICVYPRHYITLANMNFWHEWREDYKQYIRKIKESKEANGAGKLNEDLFLNLIERLVEAQPINAEINETRRRAFRKFVMTAAIMLAAVGFQAFLYLCLKIQGV